MRSKMLSSLCALLLGSGLAIGQDRLPTLDIPILPPSAEPRAHLLFEEKPSVAQRGMNPETVSTPVRVSTSRDTGPVSSANANPEFAIQPSPPPGAGGSQTTPTIIVDEQANTRFRTRRGNGDSWQGAYIGVHMGLGLNSSNAFDTWSWITNYPTGSLVGVNGGPLVAIKSPLSFPTDFSNSYKQFWASLLGGGQLGYNWQSGALVYGIEGDFSCNSGKSSTTFSAQPVPAIFPPLPNFFFIPGTSQGWTSTEKLDWLSTIRGRIGVTNDNTLFYATGGLAIGQVRTEYNLQTSPGSGGILAPVPPAGIGSFAQFGLPGGAATANFTNTRYGYCVGAGVETKIGQRMGWGSGWTLRLEYLFADLGTFTNTFSTPLVPVSANTVASQATGSTVFSNRLRVFEQTIQVGLNYRF